MRYTKSLDSIDDLVIKTVSGHILKRVEDYKYLGSFTSSSEKDFNTRKGMAWSACNDLHKVWTSKLSHRIKIRVFRACIEPILLYGSETWTLPVRLEKKTRWLLHQIVNEGPKSFMEKTPYLETDIWATSTSIGLSQATESTVCWPLPPCF